MKLGVKEMKKEYKKIDIDQIEVDTFIMTVIMCTYMIHIYNYT